MWRTDATLVEPGAIVKIRKPRDSKNRPTHDHFFVIISPTTEIKLGGVLTAIAISSSLRKEDIDPEIHYPLPFRDRSGGHPDTGLTKESWACVNWVHSSPIIEGDEADLEIAAEFDYHFIGPADLKALISMRDVWMAKQASESFQSKKPR
jgi:hypothetical protein